MLGRADEGEALLGAAHRAAEAAKAEDVLLDIETIQGVRLMRRQHYDEAEVVLRAALARARALHSAYSEAGVQVNLGVIRVLRLRYDEAIPYFEKAAALAGPQSRTLYSLARSNLAICYSQLGEHDRALEIHLQSVAQNERSGAKYYLHNSLGETGRTYMVKGDPKAAIPYLERALSLASEANSTRDAAIWAGNLSECYSELRDWQNAASLQSGSHPAEDRGQRAHALLQRAERGADRRRPRRFRGGRAPVPTGDRRRQETIRRLYGKRTRDSAT